MSLLSPLVSLLIALGSPQADAGDTTVRHAPLESEAEAADDSLSRRSIDWRGFLDPRTVPVANQVRIERRVILRISPQPSAMRRGFTAELPRQAPVRMAERPHGDCVSAAEIVGVADRGSRLVMYMRNRQIISAELEKACSPRDFYLGFYVERNDDGKLCVGRDRLMSRAGAKCRVSDFHRLVAVTD
ncbi:MAG: hypothetical protein VX247_08095 [Pseudomonadota bacterium]|nr:hypothetical protein [Pseudomonadota bacterium]